MPQGSRTQSTAPKKKKKASQPEIVIEGMEDILEKDLAKHKGILAQAKLDLEAFRHGRAYEVRKKRHYRALINEGKYNKDAMEEAIEQININLRHMADKTKLANEKIEFETKLISELEDQLANQYRGLKHLEEQRRDGLAD